MTTLVANQVEGFLSEAEIALLAGYAASARWGIVEIGAYRGRSTVAFAQAAAAPVYAIDPHESFVAEGGFVFAGGADRAAFMRNLLDAGVAERVRLINLPSAQAAAGWNRPVDLLWIDGDHRESAVRADVAAWTPFVVPGGVVLLHDREQAGVASALADMAATHDFERLPDCGHIAVWRRQEHVNA